MKKFIALVLTAVLATSMVACGSNTQTNSGTQDSTVNTESKIDTEGTYKTGVGTVISVNAKEQTEEKGASAQVNTTIVAASFDKDGKVVSATIDTAQNEAKFGKDGKLEKEVDLRTKNEKGEEYGMKAVSGIKKEIDEQHQALAEYFVGKTIEEIKAIPTEKKDEKHTAVPTGEDLKASVTVTIEKYVQAIEKAYNNAVETTAPVAKTGLGINVNATAKDKTAEKGASLKISTTFMVVALDEKDTVVGAQVDVSEQEVAFDLDGKVAKEATLKTKNELGDKYGMKEASGIKKEVFEQHEAFANWMVGKTTADISGVKEDDEDLRASITVNMAGYMQAFDKAVKAAK